MISPISQYIQWTVVSHIQGSIPTTSDAMTQLLQDLVGQKVSTSWLFKVMHYY